MYVCTYVCMYAASSVCFAVSQLTSTVGRAWLVPYWANRGQGSIRDRQTDATDASDRETDRPTDRQPDKLRLSEYEAQSATPAQRASGRVAKRAERERALWSSPSPPANVLTPSRALRRQPPPFCLNREKTICYEYEYLTSLPI